MKLSNRLLKHLSITKPDYDRNAVRPGIVHLGIGAFHRAHQAVYVDDLLASDPGWGIVGVSLRRPNTAKALVPQDGLYTVIERSQFRTDYRVIGSVIDTLVASDERHDVLTAMARPETKIVSLTITEKGYCHDPATGQLNPRHPDIVADLAEPHCPRSAPGFLVEALRLRREAGLCPFTVLSCDNLPSNGATCRTAVLGFAELLDSELAAWIADMVAFPCTMVDRIVPATVPQDKSVLMKDTGICDRWPVVTEPFRQWVIEDNFCAGRPAFEKVGAQLVFDVAPFETMKLRLLNGSHTALACLGLLAGYETVSEAMADPKLADFTRRLMSDEMGPTLSMPLDVDLAEYQDILIGRFCNPALQHRLIQIAADTSQKLPQRILEPLRERLAADLPVDHLAVSIASWIRLVSARDCDGYRFELNDPQLAAVRGAAEGCGGDSSALVAAILAQTSIFGVDLRHMDQLVRNMTAVLQDQGLSTS
ncbi:mannitol dehydrogenase family protein [Hoeflea sp. TYP-13]|uniref:mannitol dehydrogenase family protein n=1 Tax=Hoeflea sp. TYP-13 TaxID=3230023 RepID=UPI0034C6B03F